MRAKAWFRLRAVLPRPGEGWLWSEKSGEVMTTERSNLVGNGTYWDPAKRPSIRRFIAPLAHVGLVLLDGGRRCGVTGPRVSRGPHVRGAEGAHGSSYGPAPPPKPAGSWGSGGGPLRQASPTCFGMGPYQGQGSYGACCHALRLTRNPHYQYVYRIGSADVTLSPSSRSCPPGDDVACFASSHAITRHRHHLGDEGWVTASGTLGFRMNSKAL